jgi:hypothetical protein
VPDDQNASHVRIAASKRRKTVGKHRIAPLKRENAGKSGGRDVGFESVST